MNICILAFYSKGPSGFTKLAVVKTPIILKTTPNIGSEGYPMKRSPHANNLILLVKNIFLLKFFSRITKTGLALNLSRIVKKEFLVREKIIIASTVAGVLIFQVFFSGHLSFPRSYLPRVY